MPSYSIYPKQFATLSQRLQRNTCFVIMPFSDDLDNTYMVIDSVASAMGIKCLRADNVSTTSEPILNKICTQISQAFFIIVDITNLNPNVFYELGIAHVLRDAEKVLIIKESQTKCPSDINHLHYYPYNNNSLKDLRETLIHFFTENNVIADLSSALGFLGILPCNETLINAFLEAISNCVGDNVDTLLNLLHGKYEGVEKNELILILSELTASMTTCDGRVDLQNSLEKLLLLIVQKTYKNINISEYANRVWSRQYPALSGEWIADFSISVLDCKIYYAESFKWIEDYLSSVSPAAFDVAKYKIEIGIIKSKAAELDESLINELNSSDKTLAEHAAKLIKERNITEAIPNLLERVEKETNPYVLRSCVDSLVKIAPLNTLYKVKQLMVSRAAFVNRYWFIQKHISDLDLRIEELLNAKSD